MHASKRGSMTWTLVISIECPHSVNVRWFPCERCGLVSVIPRWYACSVWTLWLVVLNAVCTCMGARAHYGESSGHRLQQKWNRSVKKLLKRQLRFDGNREFTIQCNKLYFTSKTATFKHGQLGYLPTRVAFIQKPIYSGNVEDTWKKLGELGFFRKKREEDTKESGKNVLKQLTRAAFYGTIIS